ncbi:hypothetical protein C8R48DRAFT_701075 [Suillus tomentosus]|nr:hypothetical protein C8R48DRAFT_701075 [Suillus tomentosus]
MNVRRTRNYRGMSCFVLLMTLTPMRPISLLVFIGKSSTTEYRRSFSTDHPVIPLGCRRCAHSVLTQIIYSARWIVPQLSTCMRRFYF